MKGKGGNAGNGSLPIEKKYLNPQPEGIVTSSSIPFLALSPSMDQISPILEEGELQQFEVHKENGEVNRGSQETIPILLESPRVDVNM